MIRGKKKFLYLENKIINNIKSYDLKYFISFEGNSVSADLKLKGEISQKANIFE